MIWSVDDANRVAAALATAYEVTGRKEGTVRGKAMWCTWRGVLMGGMRCLVSHEGRVAWNEILAVLLAASLVVSAEVARLPG